MIARGLPWLLTAGLALGTPGRAWAQGRAVEPAGEEDAEALPDEEDGSADQGDPDAHDEDAHDEDAHDEDALDDDEAVEAEPSAAADDTTTAAVEDASTTEDAPSEGPGATPAELQIDVGYAPGGYHRPGEIMERAPVDGQRNIVIGSILVPLGTLATVSSAVGLWLTAPAHCTERLASVGVTVSGPGDCRGVFTFNVIRTTYGALMLISGSVILGIGLVQRQRYREWRHRHGMRAWLGPMPTRQGLGAAAGLRLRF